MVDSKRKSGSESLSKSAENLYYGCNKENMNRSSSSISRKTDAHKSMNQRLVYLQERKLEQKDNTIKQLQAEVQRLQEEKIEVNDNTDTRKVLESLQTENKELKEEVETLQFQLNSVKEEHNKEMADLEYSLKLKYENIFKTKLREQQIEFDKKVSNREAGTKYSARSMHVTPEHTPKTLY